MSFSALSRVAIFFASFALALATSACGSSGGSGGPPSMFTGGGTDSGGSGLYTGPPGDGAPLGPQPGTDSGDGGSVDASFEAQTVYLFDGTTGYCGDGVLQAGEQCDDGNTKPGDGCSGTCQIEPGWSCSAGKCTYQWVCGNGTLDPGEACDLGILNGAAMSGCTANCEKVPGFACPDAGGMCTRADLCGDGRVDQPSEQCDLGVQNGIRGSGCSSICLLEPGFTCPDGGAAIDAGCTQAAAQSCGNGVLDPGETCDDGNTKPGDGCSGTCQTEPGFQCKAPGQACVRQCGNGVLDPGEQCDLGAANGTGKGCSSSCEIDVNFMCSGVVGGDASGCLPTNNCGNSHVDPGEQCDTGSHNGTGGCTTTCAIVPGWQCPTAGAACSTICGDGMVVAPYEQCDFGPGNGTGGCSKSCTFQPGYACPPGATSACPTTACGDGVLGNSEECDDGNLRPYDGCSPTCMLEPTCTAGTCGAICGDGEVSPGEACDDGNTVAGDGCSPKCTVETGFTCTTVTQPPAATIVIPILYRDMHYCSGSACGPNVQNGIPDGTTTPNAALTPPTPANGHPDFNRDQYNIGPSTGRPGLVNAKLGADNEPIYASGEGLVLTGPIPFCWWYHDAGCDPLQAQNPYAKDVWLDALGSPTTLSLAAGANGVYQFDNQAFFPLDNLGWNDPDAATNPGWYNDPQTTVDQSIAGYDGGPAPAPAPHNFSFTSELHYRFTFNAAQAASPTPAVFSFTGDDDVWAFINGQLVVDLGGMHDALTRSVALNTAFATSIGIRDQGIYSIDLFQAERHVFRSTYLLSLQDFVHQISSCKTTCGDGIAAGAEQCDLGAANKDNEYGGCSTKCTLNGYCGDALIQNPPEQCDLGTAKNTGGSSGCNANCTLGPYCGDGILQSPPEQCDYGTANNTGVYGGCAANCTLGPYCGDGVKNGAEQCDLGTGKNTGGYGGCNANCTLGPACGDGVVDTANGEACDRGGQNVAAAAATYGQGACTTACQFAPYCGDGTVQAPEQCDDGSKNGTAQSACDLECKLKCGDGVLQPGEQCDLGAANNTGAYGGCTATCALASYCGDGVVQSPPEQCDQGAANVPPSAAYGVGVCTQACTVAPYCGDGIVETQFGEVCDGTPGCAVDCKSVHSIGPPK